MACLLLGPTATAVSDYLLLLPWELTYRHAPADPDNTRTPLIAWGKGIRGPLPDSEPSSHDQYSASWGLSHILRRDVEQADISIMMSSLLGINWPVNSVGVLPDVDPTRPGYLHPREGEKTLAEAALVNAQVRGIGWWHWA